MTPDPGPPAADGGQPPAPPRRARRREVLAWAMYDWANSAYSTLSITILAGYLTDKNGIFPEATHGALGPFIWGWGIGATMLLSALLSPVLGAIADAHSSKRGWLAATAFTGAAASALMFFATPDRAWLLVALFLVANVAVELSFCFSNAFLPEIAADHEMGRVSSWGFGLGYLGGGLVLALVILLLYFGERWGLPTEDFFLLRLGLLIMGLWWGAFTLPTVLVLRDKRPPAVAPRGFVPAARQALREVGGTLRNIRRFRVLFLFLLGYLVFNDGVQTVISQSRVFAEREVDMDTKELGLVILLIQFVALPGSIAVGWLADRFGQKPALVGCLLVWIAVLSLAFFIRSKAQFWVMAAVIGLVLGGVQSVSRAIMGLMTPERHSGEFFGFFNFSGKATSVFGPVLFPSILALTDSARLSLISLLVFFVVGLAIIAPLDIAAGQRQAREKV